MFKIRTFCATYRQNGNCFIEKRNVIQEKEKIEKAAKEEKIEKIIKKIRHSGNIARLDTNL